MLETVGLLYAEIVPQVHEIISFVGKNDRVKLDNIFGVAGSTARNHNLVVVMYRYVILHWK